jgi:uncharacterized protein YgiM (DUF1202 family)
MWSLILGLIAILALVFYFVFTLLFIQLFQVTSDTPLPATPTPLPTFTATATPTTLVIAQAPSATPSFTPSPNPTPTISPTPEPTPTDLPTITPTPASPQVMAANTVNVRAGPGTDYPVLGSLPPNTSLLITGRNQEGTWWQIQLPGNAVGWVAASAVEAQNAGAGIPVAQAPPPPQPTPTPVPPTPTRPAYQFEPTGWYGAKNYGLTRFLGTITDVNGNPVDGVTVEAQCGTYHVISHPSGPVGGFGRSDGMHNPPGWYDITLDRKPVPCKWVLTVVYTEDGQNVLARLSQGIEVEVTTEQSIITANWRKNW